jgi:hypothetical protein
MRTIAVYPSLQQRDYPMKTEQQIAKAQRKTNLKIGAAIALFILLVSFVRQMVNIYAIRYQLESPLIPERIIGEIRKQFIFHAVVFAISNLLGFVLYFRDRFLWVIILASFILIADRFIYI